MTVEPLRLRRLQRRAALERATVLVGGQRALAAVLHVSERSVRGWLGFDRDIGDGVLLDTAEQLEAHAKDCFKHALAIRQLALAHAADTVGADTSEDRIAKAVAINSPERKKP